MMGMMVTVVMSKRNKMVMRLQEVEVEMDVQVETEMPYTLPPC